MLSPTNSKVTVYPVMLVWLVAKSSWTWTVCLLAKTTPTWSAGVAKSDGVTFIAGMHALLLSSVALRPMYAVPSMGDTGVPDGGGGLSLE